MIMPEKAVKIARINIPSEALLNIVSSSCIWTPDRVPLQPTVR